MFLTVTAQKMRRHKKSILKMANQKTTLQKRQIDPGDEKAGQATGCVAATVSANAVAAVTLLVTEHVAWTHLASLSYASFATSSSDHCQSC